MLPESFLPRFISIAIPLFLIVLATIHYRIKLYQRLTSLGKDVRLLISSNSHAEGKKPRLVDRLVDRYQRAGKYLDQVNAAALIEQLYGQEEIKVLGWAIGYDKIEEFSRVLPNLLIAFGLLGTFLGITVNLFELSRKVAETQSNLTISFESLNVPLQGMSIAFITSLFGLLCSVLMTIFNNIFNVGIAKNQLFSLLEDYLENICQAESHSTRTDLLIAKVAGQFENFLDRFGQTVRRAVDESLKDNIDRIREANLRTSQLAEIAFTRLIESSGTIQVGADKFQEASREFTAASLIFQDSQFARILSTSILELSNAQQDFAQSSSTLVSFTHGIQQEISELQDTTQKLTQLTQQLLEANRNSVEILELHRGNQANLCEIIPGLQAGSQSLQAGLAILRESKQQVDRRIENLHEVQIELGNIVTALNAYTEATNSGIAALSNNFVSNLKEQSKIVSENMLDVLSQNMDSQAEAMNQKVQILLNSFEDLSEKQANRFYNHSEKELTLVRNIITEIQTCTRYLNEVRNEISMIETNLGSEFEKIATSFYSPNSD